MVSTSCKDARARSTAEQTDDYYHPAHDRQLSSAGREKINRVRGPNKNRHLSTVRWVKKEQVPALAIFVQGSLWVVVGD